MVCDEDDSLEFFHFKFLLALSSLLKFFIDDDFLNGRTYCFLCFHSFQLEKLLKFLAKEHNFLFHILKIVIISFNLIN